MKLLASFTDTTSPVEKATLVKQADLFSTEQKNTLMISNTRGLLGQLQQHIYKIMVAVPILMEFTYCV